MAWREVRAASEFYLEIQVVDMLGPFSANGMIQFKYFLCFFYQYEYIKEDTSSASVSPKTKTQTLDLDDGHSSFIHLQTIEIATTSY